MFTCVICSLHVKMNQLICSYAAWTSRRIHAKARKEEQKLRVIPSAGCRLTYLQFAGEFTCSVTADCLPFLVLILVISSILFAIASIFNCNCGFFCVQFCIFSFANVGDFARKFHVFCVQNYLENTP